MKNASGQLRCDLIHPPSRTQLWLAMVPQHNITIYEAKKLLLTFSSSFSCFHTEWRFSFATFNAYNLEFSTHRSPSESLNTAAEERDRARTDAHEQNPLGPVVWDTEGVRGAPGHGQEAADECGHQ